MNFLYWQIMSEKDKNIDRIVSILREEIGPKQVFLFGSRANPDAEVAPNSDYDIAIEADSLSHRSLRRAHDLIDSALGIYSFDLINLNECSEEMKQLIEEKGRVIYERN